MRTSLLRFFFTLGLGLELGRGRIDPALPILTEEKPGFADGVGAVL